jgi:nucleoside-diphosphate-sugar epimerase
MKIILTGSSGRLGRAIYNALIGKHEVIGIDRTPFSTTSVVADFVDVKLLTKVFEGADAVIHTAALHAPHVGIYSDAEFRRINVEGTKAIIEAIRAKHVKRLVFTSTTAVYGHVIINGIVPWITESTLPQPRTIYHTTKLEAESTLLNAASESLDVRVLRMSRGFPERADLMVLYRLSRGIDIRDVAVAHVEALTNNGEQYQQYIISGKTPFLREDCELLGSDLKAVLLKRAPKVVTEFDERGWTLPAFLDRVYDSSLAQTYLNWTPRYGFEEILHQLDRGSLEVLPNHHSKTQEE